MRKNLGILLMVCLVIIIGTLFAGCSSNAKNDNSKFNVTYSYVGYPALLDTYLNVEGKIENLLSTVVTVEFTMYVKAGNASDAASKQVTLNGREVQDFYFTFYNWETKAGNNNTTTSYRIIIL